MPNGINSVSPNIRDFLLKKNLILADTITNNNLSSVAVGLGHESVLETLPSNVKASIDIDVSNPIHREKQILKNQYISTEQMVSATIIDNSFSYKQIDGGYIDNNKKLNIGGPSTQPYDIAGALLGGNGFGLGSKGIDPQFDIRSSLAGRVLNATGVINDTPLGTIAGQQMLLALGQRAIFNVQKDLNVNPISLIKGNSLFNTDWSITVPDNSSKSVVGKIFDSALHLSGFEKPKSIVNPSATILNPNYSKSLLKSTGKGQLTGLFTQLNALNYKDSTSVRYAPDYKLDDGSGVINVNEYPLKSQDTYLKNSDGTDFIWGQPKDIPINNPNSLLQKTKNIFKSYKLTESLFGTRPTEAYNKELQTPSYGNTTSRGSGVINGDVLMGDLSGNDNKIYSRTWSSTDRYDKVSNLVKHGAFNGEGAKSGLIKYKDRIRENIEHSVLGSNGFVKIAPYRVPESLNEGEKDDAKKYMFSIENLAWDNKTDKLPQNEIGVGDRTTGTKGRVMWFPPYDISFSDSTALTWDTVNFIGRGEPLYTYSNTERSGQLDFKIIIDYPDYLNNPQLKSDEIIASIVAGSLDYVKYFSVDEIAKIKSNGFLPTKNVEATLESEPSSFDIYFPNDAYVIDESYETFGDDGIPINSYSPTTIGQDGTEWPNKMDYGLNNPWGRGVNAFQTKLKSDLLNCSSCKIKLDGYASADGTSAHNKTLSVNRNNSVKEWLLVFLGSEYSDRIIVANSYGDTKKSTTEGTVDSILKKIDRKVTIYFEIDVAKDEQIASATEIPKEKVASNIDLPKNVKVRFHNEGEYFSALNDSNTESDKIIYNTIREKIKFFQPAFHSTTPEGFNSRLTFLQQCTRQGPTDSKSGTNNLVFGAPPVCILRIGDFYHTKIIMNSMNITYDPLVWDLNPEGVGVQPMIAKVSISFKYIGGSSLKGPINELQNAVSFNYFANTEIYDPRANTLIESASVGKTDISQAVLDKSDVNLTRSANDTFTSLLDSIPNNDQKSAAEIENSKPVVQPPDAPKIIGFDTITSTSTFVEAISYVKPEDSIIINSNGALIDIGLTSFIDKFNTTITFITKTEGILGDEDNAFYQNFLNKGFKVVLSRVMNSTELKINKVIKSIVFLTVAEIKLALLTGYGFNVMGMEAGDYEIKLENNGTKLDIYQFILNKDKTTVDYLKTN